MPESSPKEERVIKAEYLYKDERGKIDNYALPEPINWLGLITSKAATLRGNHFHPDQEQKTLLVSGRSLNFYKDISIPDSPTKHHIVESGDLVITPPNVAHAVIFLKDSILINLVSGERIPENYGEHTRSYELVKKENIEKHISQFSSSV